MLVAPLTAADRVIGAVIVRVEHPAALGEREISLVRSLTTYAAIALANAAAYTQLERTIVALQTAQAKLAQKTAEFERLSLTDTLTGVANRRALNERAQVEIAALRRTPGGLAVVMFDVDHFKRVNDTCGHAVGDLVLERIASLAKKFLRPSDLIARLGGEEFALLLPMVGVDEAAAIAERIRAAIAASSVSFATGTVRVSCSFGVAAFDDRFASIEETLNRADSMLYRAKQNGRDRVEIDARSGATRSADARADER
jgi:diguanylate cyclase (GGDEF)-like protein